jgi:beta-lactamase regulating signal transducer with metallopeptidase domain
MGGWPYNHTTNHELGHFLVLMHKNNHGSQKDYLHFYLSYFLFVVSYFFPLLLLFNKYMNMFSKTHGQLLDRHEHLF